MNDEGQIALYHQLTEKALAKVFGRFKENPKLILTESDLKCWLFLELVKDIEGMQESTLSVHTEVTHYPRIEPNLKKFFMRDLTILDSVNVVENEEIWDNHGTGDYALSKGFNHQGCAMHFELKLIRQGRKEASKLALDSSDIANLKNVEVGKRGYSIVWMSRNENYDLDFLIKEMNESFEMCNNDLGDKDLLRFYLCDLHNYKSYKFDVNR